MVKMSRLERSQMAHRRIYREYCNRTDYKGRRKAFYHWDCHKAQEDFGRILTKNEKKKLWNSHSSN